MIAPLLGLIGTMIVFGTVIGIGARRIRQRRNLIAGGVSIQALIIGIRPQSVGETWSYHPVVGYQLHGRSWQSEPMGGQHRIRPRGWKSAASGDQFIGQALEVLVDPQDPTRSAVRGTDRLGAVMVVLGVVFGGMILLLALLGIMVTVLGLA